MKKVVVLLSLFALTACSDGPGDKANVRRKDRLTKLVKGAAHDDKECPTNIVGIYETTLEGKDDKNPGPKLVIEFSKEKNDRLTFEAVVEGTDLRERNIVDGRNRVVSQPGEDKKYSALSCVNSSIEILEQGESGTSVGKSKITVEKDGSLRMEEMSDAKDRKIRVLKRVKATE